MLTLIIKADGDGKDIFEKHEKVLACALTYEREVNVMFLSHPQYPGLHDLKQLTVQADNHQLFVCSHKTSDEEMIAMALSLSGNDDVLLLTQTTTVEVVNEILTRRAQGYKIVKTRKKTNPFHQMFRILGNWSYNIGVKILGKNSDNFAEAEVMYLDSKIVATLVSNIAYTRELRICNTFPDTKHMTIETKHVFDDEPKVAKQEKTMFNYGMWSFVFLLIFVALTSIYPFFFNFVYSWWMIVLIVAWVGLGILATFVYAKKVLFKRVDLPNRVNSFGEPLFGFDYHYETGDEIKERKPLPKLDKPIIKNKIRKN